MNRGRLIRVLAPCDERDELARGLIPNSDGLHFSAYTIRSERGNLNVSRIVLMLFSILEHAQELDRIQLRVLDNGEWKTVYDADRRQRVMDRDLTDQRKSQDVWFPTTYIPRVCKQ